MYPNTGFIKCFNELELSPIDLSGISSQKETQKRLIQKKKI